MELTITFYCPNGSGNCIRGTNEEQIETINIRRGQRKQIKCGFCEDIAVEIQANKKP